MNIPFRKTEDGFESQCQIVRNFYSQISFKSNPYFQTKESTLPYAFDTAIVASY